MAARRGQCGLGKVSPRQCGSKLNSKWRKTLGCRRKGENDRARWQSKDRRESETRELMTKVRRTYSQSWSCFLKKKNQKNKNLVFWFPADIKANTFHFLFVSISFQSIFFLHSICNIILLKINDIAYVICNITFYITYSICDMILSRIQKKG